MNTPRPARSIAIIGGGIGGVAAAVALRQVGIEATVYERAPQMREVGAGMMLWPNATRVLREMGLLENVMTRAGASSHFLVRASDGKVLMNIALGAFDVPAICVRRTDLLSVLLSALQPKQVRLGHEFHHLEQASDQVRIHFADGTVKEHDAVIGADGIRSRVRRELFGASDPIYRGYSIWRGVARYEGSAIGPGTNSETWGAGKRFGILDIGQVSLPVCHLECRGSSCGRARWTKAEIEPAFAGWHEPIANLIAATNESEILKNGVYDHAPVRRWGEGRVTLWAMRPIRVLPNLGQGGCLALEDALVLAKCVAKENSIEPALRRYESLRYSRTRHIQQRSLLMGHVGQWENRLIVGGRRVVTKLLPARLFEHNLRKVYSYEAPGA